MIFYCTDYPGGVARDTGERYTATTARKTAPAAKSGQLLLARRPVTVDADLFAGFDPLMPPGETADIIHWSHSGYHVRDALGARKDDQRVIASGIDIAIDKMWAALNSNGLMFSVHQTRDLSDGLPSQMLPVSHSYCGALDDVPQRIDARVSQLGGYAAAVNFASPLKFPGMSEANWEVLKRPEGWDRLGVAQVRALRLLSFIAYDFSNAGKAALEIPADRGRLGAYVDEFKSIVAQNNGHIIVKCAFQMLSKSQAVAESLDRIAKRLRSNTTDYRAEMIAAITG